jgi:hypothetical protein
VHGQSNLVSEEEIPALRPPRGELPATFWEQYGLWVVLGGILLLVIMSGVIWLVTRPKPPVIVPPAVVAREALEPLKQKAEDGLVLSKVSQVLRRYVAAAFGLPTGEFTTGEFCQELRSQERVGSELSSEVSVFLQECDRRKFAPDSAAAPVLPPGAVTRASRLIDQAEARRAQLNQAADTSAAPQ